MNAPVTSWSIRSVWAFLAGNARVRVFGCYKNGETPALLLSVDQLPSLVIYPQAGVTSNEAEPTLRGAFPAPRTGQTSKTEQAARPYTVIARVLHSPRPHLRKLTLHGVLPEVNRRFGKGMSGYREETFSGRWKLLPVPCNRIRFC